ncbi:DnaJ domain-containing protein [Aspergillus bertholletiae]|uniref:DnaJ domain-containing protein n=1 Tax=Aspergillus bertholletiae TaxID=1226010 RepID=A0A5N7B146_9EURO|nr:DnaJ domain-containing protein [Aspergillus bertholletiae]
MGQTHSSNSHEGAGSNPVKSEGKVDYYELLQVERNASSEEIKKAYRRRALELHPDRNYGNAEAATRLFAEIQSAYEVLSDVQERAWYDSHRGVFLGEDDKPEGADYSYDMRMTTSDDILKLFSKFSPRMDFTDASTGFYGALRETFARLALEETMACRWENVACVKYPTFGNCNADPEEVVRPFYVAWSNFSTKKSFAWKDVYRYSEAPDRRVRRLMEKENKRLREDAIREFNEAIRSLVAFVKKRDPRYKPNTQSESQRQEVLRQSAAAQAARSRAANQAKLRDHVMQDWAKTESLGEEFSDTSDDEIEYFECVACHKTFKSHNQFETHERSKKHIKAVKQLRWEMRVQNEELGLKGNVSSHEEPQGAYSTPNRSQDDPVRIMSSPIQQTQDSETENNIRTDKYTFSDTRLDVEPDECSSAHTEHHEDSIPDLSEADYVPRKCSEQWLSSQATLTPQTGDMEPMNNLSNEFSATEIGGSQTFTPKVGKAKQRRAKKAQRAMNQLQDIKCATCSATFPSRSQLFIHIHEFGHAQPSPMANAQKGKQ